MRTRWGQSPQPPGLPGGFGRRAPENRQFCGLPSFKTDGSSRLDLSAALPHSIPHNSRMSANAPARGLPKCVFLDNFFALLGSVSKPSRTFQCRVCNELNSWRPGTGENCRGAAYCLITQPTHAVACCWNSGSWTRTATILRGGRTGVTRY